MADMKLHKMMDYLDAAEVWRLRDRFPAGKRSHLLRASVLFVNRALELDEATNTKVSTEKFKDCLRETEA